MNDGVVITILAPDDDYPEITRRIKILLGEMGYQEVARHDHLVRGPVWIGDVKAGQRTGTPVPPPEKPTTDPC